MGRDATFPDTTSEYARISIHAPAWGATLVRRSSWIKTKNFNPRARVGRDDELFKGGVRVRISIHAPAWGATSNPPTSSDQPHHFNPRARVGRDTNIPCIITSAYIISIHAPAWGATAGGKEAYGQLVISIHAPVWGATNEYVYWGKVLEISIHAPVWGATRGWLPWRPSGSYFNPRARVGRDEVHAIRTDA